MPDARTLRQKLEAMSADTSSPHEAAIARAMLEKMPVSAPRNETRRILTREVVMAAPDRVSGTRHGVAVRFPAGRWVHMYEDEADWELIESYQMPWRWEGSSEIITPKPGVTPNRRTQLS